MKTVDRFLNRHADTFESILVLAILAIAAFGCLYLVGAGVIYVVAALNHLPYFEYVVHFAVEVVGQGVLVLTYKHVCSKDWHRFAIWFLGTLLTTILTVHLVG